MNSRFKDIIFIFCLLASSITRFVLPGTGEQFLTIYFNKLSIYLPDTLFILVPMICIRPHKKVNKIGFVNLICCLLLICLFYSAFFGFEMNHSFYPLLLLIIYLFIFYYVCSMQISQGAERIYAYICFMLVVFLSVQQSLFATGILSVQNIGQIKGTFLGLNRIDGTVGSSNSAAIIMLIATGVCFDVFQRPKDKKIQFLAIVIGIIGIFMTLSRGGILLLFGSFACFYLINMYKKMSSTGGTKTYIFSLKEFALLFFVILIFYFGFVDILMERTVEAGPVGFSRTFRALGAIDHWKNLGITGLGCYYENMWFSPAWTDQISRSLYYLGSPHNMYVVMLVESGFIALIFFIILNINISFIMLKHSKFLSASIVVMIILFGFNIECFYFNIRYFVFLLFFISWVMKKSN